MRRTRAQGLAGAEMMGIGRNYRLATGAAYIGTRPSRASVQGICRRVSELTTPRYVLLPPRVVVRRLNRLLTG